MRLCRYCQSVELKNHLAIYCSRSCRMRFARGVPRGKKFKDVPRLVESSDRRWQHLVEFPNYEISNDGLVRRKVDGSNTKAGNLIRCSLTTSGYPHYMLTDAAGNRRHTRAHRLVAISFLSPPLPHQTNVLHYNDNPLDVRAENLRWGTSQDNSDDMLRNGRSPGWRKRQSHPETSWSFLNFGKPRNNDGCKRCACMRSKIVHWNKKLKAPT